MRILQIHNRYRQPGGEDSVVFNQTRLLSSAGHTVDEHLATNPGKALGATTALAVAPWNPAAVQRVRRHITGFRPDVIHLHNTWFTLSPAVVWEASRRAPVVLTLHNYRLGCIAGNLLRDGDLCRDCVGKTPWSGVIHRCYRDRLLPSAVAGASLGLHRLLGTYRNKVKVFLALTEYLRSVMVECGLPAERVKVHQNFSADPGPRSQPPSNSSTVVFVGRISEEKGLGLLLDAWQQAALDMQLVVIGDGPLAAELGARRVPNVTWRGHLPIEEVRTELLMARALAVPSQWYEGTPITAVEGMAAALPVLATRLGALYETVGEETGPYLASYGDVADWVRALHALGDDHTVDGIGRLLRTRYEATHTPTAALQRLEHAYQEATA